MNSVWRQSDNESQTYLLLKPPKNSEESYFFCLILIENVSHCVTVFSQSGSKLLFRDVYQQDVENYHFPGLTDTLPTRITKRSYFISDISSHIYEGR